MSEAKPLNRQVVLIAKAFKDGKVIRTARGYGKRAAMDLAFNTVDIPHEDVSHSTNKR